MSTEAWFFFVAYVVAGWAIIALMGLVDPEQVKRMDPVAAFLVIVFWFPVLTFIVAMLIVYAVDDRRKARAGRDSTDTRAEGKG